MQTTVFSEVEQLHEQVSSQAQNLAARLGAVLTCRLGCTDCCVDDLTVFEVEADQIRRYYEHLLLSGVPRRLGACAFLDGDDACRIYPRRPYVCRTQGLPLRWFDTDQKGETAEYRDVCVLNETGLDLESMNPGDMWLIGPYEGRLATLQRRSGEELRRVSLRSLFARWEPEPREAK